MTGSLADGRICESSLFLFSFYFKLLMQTKTGDLTNTRLQHTDKFIPNFEGYRMKDTKV